MVSLAEVHTEVAGEIGRAVVARELDSGIVKEADDIGLAQVIHDIVPV